MFKSKIYVGSLFTASLLVGLGAFAGPSQAATIIYQQNFDGLNDGTINNQDGWIMDGGTGKLKQDFVVQSDVTHGGTGKALQFQRVDDDNTAWAAAPLSGIQAGHVIDITFWAYGSSAGRRSFTASLPTSTNGWQGSPFSVSTLANDALGWSEKFGYSDNGTATYSTIGFTSNTWWRFRVEYDMTAASPDDYTYSFYVMPEGGTEQAIAEHIAIPDGLTNGYIPKTLSFNRIYGGANDTWVIDDLTVTQQDAVPEPSASMFLLFGFGLLGLRQRKTAVK